MSLKATSDLWWKNAVVYCLDVDLFSADVHPLDSGHVELELEPHGFRWLRVRRARRRLPP